MILTDVGVGAHEKPAGERRMQFVDVLDRFLDDRQLPTSSHDTLTPLITACSHSHAPSTPCDTVYTDRLCQWRQREFKVGGDEPREPTVRLPD